MVTCWNEIGFGFGSEMKMKNEQWWHTRCPRADLFLIVVSSHRARAEALRRRSCHSVVRHHLSLAERRATSPQEEKKNHFDCCFFLVFLWLHARWGAAKVPVLHHFVWLWCLMSCFLVIARPHWKKKEGVFSQWSLFLLSPAGMHVRICPPASAHACDEPAEAFVSCWVFIFWGGLVEDHDVGGTIICSA